VLPVRNAFDPPEPDPVSAVDGLVPAHVASRVNPRPRNGAPTDHVR
jgi:hypothetical protein